MLSTIFSLIERFWHDKRLKWALPVFGFAGSLLYFIAASNEPALESGQVAFALLVAVVLSSAWHATHRIPKIAKDRVGIVVAIVGEDERHDDQIAIDFVGSLRQLIEVDEQRTKFELIRYPRFLAEQCVQPADAGRLLQRSRALFLIFGTVRKRMINGQSSHYLELRSVVGHASVPSGVKRQLANDIGSALPRKVIIPENNDVILFELTSSLTAIAARYSIGLAAMVSGFVQYSESLLLSAEHLLKVTPVKHDGVRQLARALPERLAVLYSMWLDAEMNEYTGRREIEFLQRADVLAEKLLARQPEHYGALLVRAMAAFTLRRNVNEAASYLELCRKVPDANWRYSLAFLHAFSGRMEEARDEYRRAFRAPHRDVTVAVQCEEFIQGVLAQEPVHGQLHFCAALINEHGKGDVVVAIEEYKAFLHHPSAVTLPIETSLAKAAVAKLEASL